MGFCDGGDRGRWRWVRRRRRARKPGMGKTTEVVEQGSRGGERGKNRDAPDWHEGLRLLAALRQLGGVRRGIEIANAHYGYFPIEGRIPLSPPVSYHASRSFSFRSLRRRAAPRRPRATPFSFSPSRSCSRSDSLSPLRSFTPYTHQLRISLYFSLSPLFPHVVFPSISPHLCLLSYRLATSFFFPPALSLSLSVLLRTLRSRAPRSARAFALRKLTLGSVHTVALICSCPIPSYL